MKPETPDLTSAKDRKITQVYAVTDALCLWEYIVCDDGTAWVQSWIEGSSSPWRELTAPQPSKAS